MKKVARSNKREGAKLLEPEATEIVTFTSPDDISEGKNSFGMSGKKKRKLNKKKRTKDTKEDDVREYLPIEVGDGSNQHSDSLDGANFDKRKKKVARSKKRGGAKLLEAETSEIVASTSPDVVSKGKNSSGMSDKKKSKLKKKKRAKETKEDGVREYVPVNEVGDDSNQQSDILDGANTDKKLKKVARSKKRGGAKLLEAETTAMSDKKKNKSKKKKRKIESRREDEVGNDSNQQNGESKSVSRIENDATLLEDRDEVYQISSGDEDEATGMKRWITEYHHARPGAEVLLQRINDFLVDYWAQKEKERKEREAEAAEGGWTVVTHVKGRKKTTEAESGTTVGSVAQAAVMDKMSKKKNKEVGLNFYRFQRREAQKNEILMLQSKFEQDKKRIQQMRAARKFRPY